MDLTPQAKHVMKQQMMLIECTILDVATKIAREKEKNEIETEDIDKA